MTTAIYPADWLQHWQWKGLSLSYLHSPALNTQAAGAAGSTVVLIHGFGACKEHWRQTIPALTTEPWRWI